MSVPCLRSSKAAFDFFSGRWAIVKRFDYRVGGSKGTLEGFVTFTEAQERNNVLMYEEKGSLKLDHMENALTAEQRYCFNTSVWPVEVYFVNDRTKTHVPPVLPELNVHTAEFISFQFPTEERTLEDEPDQATFEHV